MKLQDNKTKTILSGEICVQASLKCTIDELESKLAALPGLKQVSRGTSIKFILISNPDDIEQKITFCTTSMVINYYFAKRVSYHKTRALINLISISIFLSDCYDLHTQSLYPYIIEVLSDALNISIPDTENNVVKDQLKQKIATMNMVNLCLSKQMIKNKQDLDKAVSSANRCKRLMAQILERLSETHNQKEDAQVLKLIGVEQSAINEYNQELLVYNKKQR